MECRRRSARVRRGPGRLRPLARNRNSSSRVSPTRTTAASRASLAVRTTSARSTTPGRPSTRAPAAKPSDDGRRQRVRRDQASHAAHAEGQHHRVGRHVLAVRKAHPRLGRFAWVPDSAARLQRTPPPSSCTVATSARVSAPAPPRGKPQPTACPSKRSAKATPALPGRARIEVGVDSRARQPRRRPLGVEPSRQGRDLEAGHGPLDVAMQHDAVPSPTGCAIGVSGFTQLTRSRTQDRRRPARRASRERTRACVAEPGLRVGVGGKCPARSRRLLGHGHTGTPGCGLVRSADEPVVLRADDDRGP
jgi:hypothetical protein